MEATAEMPGRVYYVQAVLPGDVIEPGVAMLILDTDTISWTQVSIIALVVIAAIAAVITWWYCCCRSKQETPDVDEPRVRAVILDFETDTGWNQRAIWKYQPLGLGFYENQVPLSVAYIGHDASHMGVLRDDVLVGIGDDKVLVLFSCSAACILQVFICSFVLVLEALSVWLRRLENAS